MAPNPQLTYLDRVVMEIIETERMYVRDLRMIVEDYLAHIIDQCDLSIRPEQVCSLFGNIEDIYEFNSELLQALDLCDNDPVAVARCFVMKSEYFEIYTQYCTNYPKYVRLVDEVFPAAFGDEQHAVEQEQRSLVFSSMNFEGSLQNQFSVRERERESISQSATRGRQREMKPIRNRSGVFDVPQHSDSDGGAPGERRLLQPATSSSTLGESWRDEEEKEELCSRKDSLERLACSEEDEEEEVARLSRQRSHRTAAEDSEPDDILTEDEQVDDFASSVLAAISCWHYRAQALLSTEVAMVTEAEAGSISSNGCNKESRHLLEEDEPEGTEPTNERLNNSRVDDSQASTHKLPQETMSESEPAEIPEPEPSSDLDSLPPRISTSSKLSEEVRLERDPEPTEQPSSATPDSDSKTLSSAESSEDEEDVKEAAEKEGKATSILPSSVLDKASTIAQHFTNSIKRGSLGQDDTHSTGCTSPRLPSRTGSSLSLSAEPANRPVGINSVSSDAGETFGVADLTLLSPRDDSLFDADRGIRRRRDSTLSKQDQLLIGKIKSYYENAESQDATFSLQRRESLTYIPSGLVRSSVSRFNSIPKEETVQTNPSTSTTSSSLDPISAELNLDTRGYMVSSDSLDSLKSDLRSTDPEDSGESHRSRSQSIQDNPSEDEEFRPSSEMIKIWQSMERGITRSQSEDKGRYREAPRNSRVTNVSLSDTTKTPNKSCDQESGASDLSTITEESTSPSPLKHKDTSVNRTGSLKDSLKVFGEEAVLLRVPVPRVVQLKAEEERPNENLNQLDDLDKTKSKVLHLARQYSQRIKTTKPVIRQRSQGVLISKKSLPCVLEEKDSTAGLSYSRLLHQRSTEQFPVSQFLLLFFYRNLLNFTFDFI
ncbi:pleckstrin homology domain-containing family G member 3-like [Morone saxatilis]|uniref:pleckstrin homology domain-containing family G member 3-like n=1 Tax=Morone saxatilis TaxID=34816 RepID=UPI0015E22BD9|nr:pleckstrin homology domain-containing family G member 3-like [Morone saxatilis]